MVSSLRSGRQPFLRFPLHRIVSFFLTSVVTLLLGGNSHLTQAEKVLKPGDFVRIKNRSVDGNRNGKVPAALYNGRYGFVEDVVGDEKCRVTLAAGAQEQGRSRIQISVDSVAKVNQKMDAKKHEVVMFFPSDDLPKTAADIRVTGGKRSPLRSWPKDWTQETEWLKGQLGWTQPEVVGGVTRAGLAKADLMMYFDAGDETGVPNVLAQTVADHLPEYQFTGKAKPKRGYRGVCILVYSPTFTTDFSSEDGDGSVGPVVAASTGVRFSLREMQDILFFHVTKDAGEMYAQHDKPWHRVFGHKDLEEYMEAKNYFEDIADEITHVKVEL